MSWGGLLFVVLAAADTSGAAAGSAATATPSARELLDQVQKLNHTTRAWKDRSQRMQVTIINRRNVQWQREMEVRTKKYGPEASRSILFFLKPADVRGVGILQWLAPDEEDRQWLFLPELKRPRQISGSSKRQSFVGTDFSYEDLAIMSDVLDWSEQDASAAIVGEGQVDAHPCAIIEFEPRGVDVGYGKIRMWLDRDALVMRKLELEDKKGRLAKTLFTSDLRPIGQIPTAYALEMRDERAGSRTRVVFTEIRYDTGIPEDEFTQRRLERGL